MGSLRRRISRLEETGSGPSILGLSLRESGLDAPTFHRLRALTRATPDELEELERCRAAFAKVRDGYEDEDEDDPIIDPAESDYLETLETIMRREAPTLADHFRVRRDLLWRELDRLKTQWEAQGRNRSTWQSDPAYWMVATAATNRRAAINQGAALVEDPGEARRTVGLIVDPGTTTEEMFALIGRR